jgi:hypothetical protein
MQVRAAVLLVILAAVGLTGCRFFGDDSSKGAATGGGPVPPTANNHAPTISGSPITSATVNTAYSFKPTSSDQDGDTLTFNVANKPSWAAFDPRTGRLYGTPSSSSGGSFANVQITVTDGKTTASLPPFTIAVANTAVVGTATLSWQAPMQNADGTPLTDLAGYTIRYGANVAAMNQKVAIDNAGVTTYVIDNLPVGTWYFSLASVNRSGVESNPTDAVSITIG